MYVSVYVCIHNEFIRDPVEFHGLLLDVELSYLITTLRHITKKMCLYSWLSVTMNYVIINTVNICMPTVIINKLSTLPTRCIMSRNHHWQRYTIYYIYCNQCNPCKKHKFVGISCIVIIVIIWLP